MPTDPARIASLMSDAIASAAQSYADGGSLRAFEKEMASIVARGHMAGWLAGTSERLGVPLDSPLLSQARLSKAERADIKALVNNQLEYLKGFTDEAGDMSDAAVAARAGLYAGSVKGSYWKSAIDASLPAYPGDGSSECLGNCGCAWQQSGDEYTWVLGKADNCATCAQRAGEWAPYKGGEE